MLGPRPDTQIVVGLEASGGLERNWLRLFRDLAATRQVTSYLLNPLAVKRFLERDLHRCVTDALSARGIARYLRDGMRPQEVPYEPHLEGCLTLYRTLRAAIERQAAVQNELKSLLPRVQPGLVQYCRKAFPAWLLTLLARYPTAAKLARAKPETLARIPFLTLGRARTLAGQARESVAAQRDDETGTAVAFLAREIVRAGGTIDEIRKDLCADLRGDEGVRIMSSIPGIGLWSAVCLRLEIGPIERFPAPGSLVAYAGLDPRIRQSGDKESHIGISRRGRRQIRAILFMCALVAIQHNPVVREFYARLRAAGKKPKVCVVACMRKLLHLAYGCWISGKPFDPDHTRGARKTPGANMPATESTTAEAPVPPTLEPTPSRAPQSLDAPVSQREAKKRKAAAMPQTPTGRRMRGPGTALPPHCTSPSPGGPP
jgi:transposase